MKTDTKPKEKEESLKEIFERIDKEVQKQFKLWEFGRFKKEEKH